MLSCNSTVASEYQEPVAIQRNIPEIFEIFHNVQFNTIQHKKYVKEMKNIFRKMDHDAFRSCFTNALYYLFMFGEANGNVDRVMQFVANFCSSVADEEFLQYVFGVLFECVSVSGHGVRARTCQLVGLILSSMGDDAFLDDDLCDKILASQLERLQDVRGAVRCRSVYALQRLQNPTDTDDPVTKAYAFHMTCDPSSAVRRAVVLAMAKNSKNLLHVLERLCDVDESVRKAAFLYVSSINVMHLKVRQRVHILKVGLTERSPRVRKVVETALLPGWLGAYHGNVLELLAAVRLDNLQGAKDSAIVAGNLLQSLFKNQQIGELLEWLPVDPRLKLIPAEHLSKESAWYWRHLVRHLHTIEDTDHLDQVLPELIIFTGYVRALVESPCPDPVEQPVEFSRRQYVLQELVSIFPVYDMADEVGRNALKSLLYDTLTGNHGPLDEDVIKAVVSAIDLMMPDTKKRIEFVAGIISEIHEPACDVLPPPTPVVPVETNEVKIMKAELRVALNEAQEDQEDAVRDKNFILAAECKEKVDALEKKLEELNADLGKLVAEPQPPVEVVRVKKNDPETLHKCLTILNLLLDSPDIKTLTPVLRSLFQNFELVIYQDPKIREIALQTVALYSILDDEFAEEQTGFFFSQFIEIDNEKLIVTALKCVIDVLCVHGVKIFKLEQDKDTKDDEKETTTKNDKSMNKSKMDKSRKSKMGADEVGSDDEIGDKTLSGSPSSHDTIIELFIRLMNHECSEYRAVVVEGFCRLLLLGRLSSSPLVSRLLLLWFNPATEDEDNLRQILGTFFPLFAASAETGQEQLEAAFLPTVITLANAPLGSPLAEVNQEGVLKFILSITRPDISPAANNIHANLAIRICNVLERGEELAAPLLCRALALLTSPRTPALCRDLLRSAESLMDIFTDKISYRNVARFHANLTLTLENFEQRESASNPGLDTLPEDKESRTSMNSSNVGSVSDANSDKNDGEVPKDKYSSSESGKVSFESDRVSSSTDISDKPDTETQTSGSCKSDGSIKSGFSSPPRKIKKLTAADVARRALKKTPRPIRTPDSPLTIPSRALDPVPDSPSSLRRSARATPARRSSEDSVGSAVATRSSRKGKGASQETVGKAQDRGAKRKEAKGLGKQLEEAVTKETASKPRKQSFEIFETKKKAPNKKAKVTKKGRTGKVTMDEKSSDESSSSSSDVFIDESSDEESICHETSQHESLMKNSSSEDEDDKRGTNRNTNMTIPETSEESSEEEEDDNDVEEEEEEEEIFPVSQNRNRRKK